MEKIYGSGHGGGEGGPSVVIGHCTGSEFSFVATSGAAASGVNCRTEAVGGGVRKSASVVVGEGGFGVARIGEDGPGDDNEGGVRGGSNVVGDCWGDRTVGRGDPWG